MTSELEGGGYLEEMKGFMMTGGVGLVTECGKQ